MSVSFGRYGPNENHLEVILRRTPCRALVRYFRRLDRGGPADVFRRHTRHHDPTNSSGRVGGDSNRVGRQAGNDLNVCSDSRATSRIQRHRGAIQTIDDELPHKQGRLTCALPCYDSHRRHIRFTRGDRASIVRSGNGAVSGQFRGRGTRGCRSKNKSTAHRITDRRQLFTIDNDIVCTYFETRIAPCGEANRIRCGVLHTGVVVAGEAVAGLVVGTVFHLELFCVELRDELTVDPDRHRTHSLLENARIRIAIAAEADRRRAQAARTEAR